MAAFEDGCAPALPSELDASGVDPLVLANLVLKSAYTVPQFTTEWAARRLCLPSGMVAKLLEQLQSEVLLEVLGASGPFGYRYAITGRGRERAGRLLEICGYIGPAPVSLAAYTAMLQWQLARTPAVTHQHVAAALSGLVLRADDVRLAGLAASSCRSLFLHGPPGNGKTTLARSLHAALQGNLWVPHCINIDEDIIRVYDSQLHQPVEIPQEMRRSIDQRWVKIRRPLIIGGGEMTLDSFELTYSPSMRFYEAPLPMKANGGTFLLDDYGRQRVDPEQMLNRWIIPLEHQIDYLTLRTGKKIRVPFLPFLIIATNLDVDRVTDPAFLRRMGYRLYLGEPTPERYAQIFEQHASARGMPAPPGLIAALLARYRNEKRELRCCEPRDLIERARDICRFSGRPPQLDEEVIALAWTGYFGNSG
jgi:MoxR-like ATPase